MASKNSMIWFYNPRFNDNLARVHRVAYEKSLKCNHGVKAQSGTYYYKGFVISNEGGSECPWSYNRPEAHDFDKEWAETKKLAMEYVDYILKDEIDLCDIMCR